MPGTDTEPRPEFDVVVVGGGLSGCALATALADGRRRILVLEARKGRNPRFNGELIHPFGVDALDAAGLYEPAKAKGGVDIEGFAVFPGAGQPPSVLPYREIPDCRPHGFAMDHHEMVDALRAETKKRPGVELRFGERVTEVLRKEERVVGVATPSGRVRAHLVFACDGRHSKIRSLLEVGERARLISYMAAARLPGHRLPRPGYGHILLGAWGPVIVYPIGDNDARTNVDLPADMDRGLSACAALIRREYLPHLEPSVAAAIGAALDSGELEMAANYSITTDDCVVPGAALVGDATGCSHPVTATGMTVGLNDTRLIRRALDGVALDDAARVDAALARYGRERNDFVRARQVLSDALYEVFRGDDDGTRAIRAGIFRYWNGSSRSRARSMALLSGHESGLPAFMREYLMVVGASTSSVLKGRVNEPSLTGRVRSLYGLAEKSLEKLGVVARGLRA
jgi:2-polyprenyl-6-methoxyphenol hydroxylase-like FAD-dependent oxidoreductase